MAGNVVDSAVVDSNDFNNSDQFRTFLGWYREDIKKARDFRREAEEDYAFYNGDQWSDEDISILHEKNRPVMTFNRIAPLVNAVTGSERNNKREVRYIPRTLGAAIPNELLTSAAEWFRDQSDAENEDSDVFSDAVICGMGWSDTRLDYDSDPSGAPVISRIDPLKMVWDANASKPNLIDAERLWYVDKKPLYLAKQLFPDIDESRLNAAWANSDSPSITEVDALSPYNDDSSRKDQSNEKMVTLVELRYFEKEPYYLVNFPDGSRDLKVEEFKAIKDQLIGIDFVKLTRKVAKRVFLGADILSEPDSPMVPKGQLGWECITAFQNKATNQFYGIVRATKDPQRWANKFFSQVMHILNSQAKGGLLVERGAFDDDRQAEQSYAKADAITWVRKGALAANAITPKPAAAFPAGFFQLFNESKEALTQVTGLSPEFIGTREVNQAGVLEAQRRQSSLNLLAGIFDALKRYRKRQGKIILYLIQNYLSDGRLIRIVGQDKSEYVPLTRGNITSVDYDIIVDDAPTSPNEKERTFAVIQQMLPLIQQYITPQMALEMLKYSPIPATLVEHWTLMIQQNQEQQSQQAEPTPQEKVEAVKLQGAQVDATSKIQSKQLDMQAQMEKNAIEARKVALAEREQLLKEQEFEARERQRAVAQAIEEEQNAVARQRNNIVFNKRSY